MMNLPLLQHTAGRLNGWLLALMAFALPLSTSALSVLAIVIVALWLIEGRFREKGRQIFTSPVAVALIAYFLLLVIGLLWTEDLGNGLDVLKKQWKIMLLPVFLTAMHCSLRRVYMGFFLAGMTVAMAMTYLAWFGLLQYADITPYHLTKGTSHVIYNPLLAMALYLLCHELIWGRVRGWLRWPLTALAGLMLFNMFITEGRSGQLVFFVLAGLLLMQYFRQQIFRTSLLVALFLPLVFTVVYLFSPVFHSRVDKACLEFTGRCSNTSSVGLRLLFWENSWEIIKQHPGKGVGTGDFLKSYAEVNARRSPKMVATDNPHNQYVLVACQLGALGLLGLGGMFVTQIVQAVVTRDEWGRVRLAFPLFFLTIMLTESYLQITATAFLFSLFSAVIYGCRSGEGSQDESTTAAVQAV